MPHFHAETCMDCGGCVGICPFDALELNHGVIHVRPSCTECDLCVRLCPVAALESIKGTPAA
ncbi:MAG: 4Fe-4S binding protein [Thermoplasmatota archaeon]